MDKLELQPLANLLGLTHSPAILDSDEFNEAQYLEIFKEAPIFLAFFHAVKLRALYWFGFYKEALQLLDTAVQGTAYMTASPMLVETYFFISLVLTTAYQETPEEERARHNQMLDNYQNRMKAWADDCPDNFLHKYLLVEAERARVAGQFTEAMALYKKGIASAQKYNYINNEALGNELYAKFWLAHNEVDFAQVHMVRAHGLFRQWGATAKVKDLEEKYPQLLAEAATRDRPLKTTATPTPRQTGSALDLTTVMKAAQAISGEIVLDALLAKIMNIILSGDGTQRRVSASIALHAS